MLHRAQRMLARLGVLSTVYEVRRPGGVSRLPDGRGGSRRSEEHTSELQSRGHLVCRLLLEKKNLLWCSRRSSYLRVDCGPPCSRSASRVWAGKLWVCLRLLVLFSRRRRSPGSTLFPYTTLFRS